MSTETTVANGPTPNPVPGRVHDNERYEGLSYIGHGGMGVVFRARDRLTGEVVALKCITLPATNEPLPTTTADVDHDAWHAARSQRLALTREFRTLATLRHPHIISVLDYGFAANAEPYFTMELIENPLTVLEAARDRSLRERLDLLVQMLRALAYLHRRGVIHRDLKPSNVLVDDRVRVVDFGIAIQRGEGLRSSGTLSHMAPEVFGGEPATEASDLYAVGVMACEVLSGRHPYAGFVDDALRTAVQSRVPDLDGIESPALRAWVERLLARNPRERFASADEAIDELIRATELPATRHTPATRDSFLCAASFVDRVDEQRALLGAVAELRSRARGGVWMIEGTSGIGKTRLLDEVRTHALVAGAKVVRGQADSDARGTFDLWREPLRNLLLGIRIEASEAAPLVAIVPDIGALIGQTVEPVQSDPQSARAQVLGSIGRVLERQRGPLVLMLEDLHLAPEGVEVLRELAPVIRELPILVIGTLRGEEAPGLAQVIPGAQQLKLAPLARGDIAALARAMLGNAHDEIVDYLDRHTEGNVFFIVEAVRALADEAGALDRIAAKPLPDQLVAAGISAVVAHRLAKLPAGLRDVLVFAAIAGRVLDPGLLEQRFGAATVGEAISCATELALLEVVDNRFRFSHDKFREHLLAALDGGERRELHRAVAEAIERVHGAGKPAATLLAYHYRAAELPEREAVFAAMAGQVALEQGAYDEATRLLERAVALFEVLSSVDPRTVLEALLSYAAVILATRSWSDPEVGRVYDRVLELAAEYGHQRDLGAALHGRAIISQFRGDFRTAGELGARCGKIAEDGDDAVGYLESLVTLANVATWLGRHDEAEPLHRRILELYDPAQLEAHMDRYGWNPAIVARVTHAVSSCICGATDVAVEMYRAAIDEAKQMKQSFMLAIAYQIAVWVHQLRGDIRETLEYAELLGEAARAAGGFPAFRVLADVCGGWAMVHAGDVEPGLRRLRDALATWHQLGARMATTFYATQLADACLATGDHDAAHRVLDAALDADLATQERCYHAELHRLRAEAFRRRGELSRAEHELHTAIELASTQRARLFEDRARRALGDLVGVKSREIG